MRQNAQPKHAQKKFDLNAAVQQENLRDIPPSFWDELNSHLDHNPALGLALASVLHAIACSAQRNAHARKPHMRAPADLALIRALNVCGEFYQATRLCADAARSFEKLGDVENAARVWLEAAWAETALGNLEGAHAHLERITNPLSPALQVRRRWIRARVWRGQGQLDDASKSFLVLLRHFQTQRDSINAPRVQRELAYTLSLRNPLRALPLLRQARRVFVRADCPLDIALCDNLMGQCYRDLSRWKFAVLKLGQASKTFMRFGALFFAAMCDLDLGFTKWRRGHFARALKILERARREFYLRNSLTEASSCEINIAGILLDQARYAEALPLLERALAQARREGRVKKAAVCLESMGWAYDKQGFYGKALEAYLRAHAEFSNAQMLERRVMCELYLGMVYVNFGQYRESLQVLKHARDAAYKNKLQSPLAEIEMTRGQVLLAVKRHRQAHTALVRARRLFQQLALPLYLATCDRLLAATNIEPEAVRLRRLKASRHVFMNHAQPVQVALTELAQSEIAIERGEWASGEQRFLHSLRVLSPAFPDHAWRAEYGLGRIALQKGDMNDAASHLLRAVEYVTRVRSGAGAEAQSNAFFGARRSLFDKALQLTCAAQRFGDAVKVIEATKAQTFLKSLPRFEPAVGEHSSPEIHKLVQQELELRAQMTKLRAQLAIPQTLNSRSIRRERGTFDIPSSPALRALNRAQRAYDKVVTRLELARRGLRGSSIMDAFSLDAFRAMAQKRWGDKWAALDYYFLSEKELYVAYVDAYNVLVEKLTLDELARIALTQCCDIQPSIRELVYRKTLNGFPIPTESPNWLAILGDALLPSALRERLRAWRDSITLLVSPHRELHHLAFQVLEYQECQWLERFEIIYTPSLQALTHLNSKTPPAHAPRRLLWLGVSEFGRRAGSLSHVAKEKTALTALARTRVTLREGPHAKRAGLFQMKERGRLKQFDAIHFATHVVFDGQNPHLSRILLTDADLTVMDISALELDAQYVFLSACSSSLGQGGEGDEVVGMARAFFFAGARALIATLWQVPDETTSRLVNLVYRNLGHGCTLAHALRRAQLKMSKAGYPTYDWAGFVVMGNA